MTSASDISTWARPKWMRFLNSAVGGALIFAAFAKLVSKGDDINDLLLPAWAKFVVIAVELALGLLLVSGLSPEFARRGSLVVFASFAGWSAIQVVHGVPRCSCLGDLYAPAGLMLSIDVFLVLWFWLTIRREHLENPVRINGRHGASSAPAPQAHCQAS